MISRQSLVHATILVVSLLLGACGGGGGGNDAPPPVSNPPPTPAPPPVSKAEIDAASRMIQRASFGIAYDELESAAQLSPETWLDQQLALPATYHRGVMEEVLSRRARGEFDAFEEDIEYLIFGRRIAWWHNTLTAPDTVRQRVAYALSQIFVVSDRVDTLEIYPYALNTYYDLLLQHAFGNYRDLLRDVTLSPAMGLYLSHLNNRAADPARNIFPDENYAREVMQLFSIGLFELNLDGSPRLDANGRPIPSYDNDDIREFAEIFTGLSFGGPGAFFGNRDEPNFSVPMQMFDAAHEPGQKQLLNGFVVPAGQSGIQDVELAIDNLFNHPNVGPFIGRQLIQRLVTSNPSPAYIERVARVFNDNGAGIRGDLRAVVRSILLDPEATSPADPLTVSGALREPLVRYITLLRQFKIDSTDSLVAATGYLIQQAVNQHPMSAPSVFNFYLPDHTPAGPIADAGLVAPEFQITNATTIIGWPNVLDAIVLGDFPAETPEGFDPVTLDFDPWIALADDTTELIRALDSLLTAGQLDPALADVWIAELDAIEDRSFRFRSALWLFLISPEYVVLQ
ncbi:MAG: DUF1800 domain-containing protein [Pseudomonadota bacterium]